MQHIRIPAVAPILTASIAGLLLFPVAFDTEGVADGVHLVTFQASAAKPLLLEFSAEVITAFNAASTNVLTAGTDATANQFLGSGDITEGTPGFYPSSNANKKYRIVADTALYVKFTQTGQVAQVETATVVEAVPGTLTAGNVTMTFVSALTGTLTITAAVATNDSQNTVATKLRAALNANTTFAAHFVASGATNAVVVTALVAAANDTSLSLTWTNAPSGLDASGASTNTTAGVAPATTGLANIYVNVTPLFPISNTIAA